MKRPKLILTVASCSIIVLLIGCSISPVTVTSTSQQAQQTAAVGPYSLEIFAASQATPPCFIFKREGKLVYKQIAEIGDNLKLLMPTRNAETLESNVTQTAIVRLTDDDALNVVIESAKGENHFEYFVFKLGDKIQKIATIVHDDPLQLEEFGSDRKSTAKFVTRHLFNDWGATTVAPQIVLRLQAGKLGLDREATKALKPLPARERLKQVIKEGFNRLPSDSDLTINFAPPELAEEILTMYYSGESAEARKFYDTCWPKNRAGKTAYWSFLMDLARNTQICPTVLLPNDASE